MLSRNTPQQGIHLRFGLWMEKLTDLRACVLLRRGLDQLRRGEKFQIRVLGAGLFSEMLRWAATHAGVHDAG